jgi:hypothetical protein
MLSPTARLVLLVLKLCPENVSAANLYAYYHEALVAHTGLSADALEGALGELERCPAREGPWLVRDPDVLWLPHPRLREPYAASEALGRNTNEHKRMVRLLSDLPAGSSTVKKFRRFSDFAKALRKRVVGRPSSPSEEASDSSKHSSEQSSKQTAELSSPGRITSSSSKGSNNGPDRVGGVGDRMLRTIVRQSHPAWGDAQVEDWIAKHGTEDSE